MIRCLIVALFLVNSVPTDAQDRDRRSGREGQPSRLTVVEQELETARRLLAELSVKLSVLDRQIRETNGRLEEAEYRNRSLEEALEKTQKQILLLSADLSDAKAAAAISGTGSRLTTGPVSQTSAGTGGNAAGPASQSDQSETIYSAASPKPGDSDGALATLSLPEGTPGEQFDFAFGYVRKNDLETGAKLLGEVVAAHGTDTVAGNALFWLGRIGLQKGQPADAARHLLTLLDTFPDHPKRADAYVDLAASLIQLGAANDACDALFEYDRLDQQGGPRLQGRAKRLASEARCS